MSLDGIFNRAAVKLRKEFYESKIVALTESSTRDWWRHMKSLMGRTSNSETEMQGLANATCDGSIELLANRQNEFLVSVSSNLPSLTNDHPAFTVYGEIPADYIMNVSVTEMALQQIKVNKSTGPDNIPAYFHVLSHATVLLRPLTALFNSSLREGVIPALWKTANVIPLPKKCPPRLIENDIRPIISLTQIISKTFESIIMTLVDTLLEEKINDSQYGGTSGTCTTDALVEMLHQWYEATDACNTYVRIIALDFSKAFDLINHEILLAKLEANGVPPHVLRWMASFLLDRTQRVEIGKHTSSIGKPNEGVPQGTVSGDIMLMIAPYLKYVLEMLYP